jgi:predicted RNA-binding protein (virulence factor B family)
LIEIGKLNTLTVVRKSDLGYMLTDGVDEILMHFKESSKELNDNDTVTVYVYTDKENRKTATMNEPVLIIDKPNFAEVVNVIEGVGVFVKNNTPKDLLISKDYLPYDSNEWPILGDKVFASLKIKKDSLVAKPVNRFDVLSLKSKTRYSEQEMVEAYVLRIAEKGIGFITNDLIYVFVPNTQLRGKYRLGQSVSLTITKMMDGEAYGTLNAHKEVLMDEDKETILNYLKDHHGVMKLTAKSSSEEVERLFNMSRKAFKRALGGLYKEELVEFDEDKTFLKEYRK